MVSVQGKNHRTVMKENEEDLALFLDLPKREHDVNDLNLFDNILDFDGFNTGSSPVSKIVVPSAPARKTATEEFLNSENGKADHDWLLAPPGSPLFPSMAMGMEKTMPCQKGAPNSRPTALRSQPMNALSDSLSFKNVTSSNAANKRSSSTTKCRPSTPTARPALPAKVKPTRPTTPTPTLRPTLPSNTKVKSSGARSSTPTARLSAPASKSTSKSATPTRRPLTPSTVSAPPRRSSSVTKSAPTTKNPKFSRGVSPPVKSRPWKPSEMPISSISIPSNSRTPLSERPSSALKGRSGAPKNSDYVSPVLLGTQMVERVINMRKLAPPSQVDNSSGFGRTLSKSSLDMAIRHMGIRRSNSGNLRPIMTKIPASSMCNVRSWDPKSKMLNVSDSPLATSSNASSSEPSLNYNTSNLDGSETGDDDISISYFASQQGR